MLSVLLLDADLGDLAELRQAELLLQRVHIRLRVYGLQQNAELPGAGAYFGLSVARALGHGIVSPGGHAPADLVHQLNRGTGDHAGSELHHLVLQHGHLDHISAQHLVLLVHLRNARKVLEEAEGRRGNQVEVQSLENVALHLEDVLLCVGLVAGVDHVPDVRH